MSSNIYIAYKSVVGEMNLYLLKLNRTQHRLEFYKKVPNDKLNDYYSIRKDFDSSDYVIYQLERNIDCLFGSVEKPTPKGIFKIHKKSEGEYLSGYREGYDKVKFFGYLVVFEDYFIHSDMYTVDVTKDNYKSAESISKKDKETSGCIRVSQDDIDWLVKNIDVGTTIIM